jgi:hypothetical protein
MVIKVCCSVLHARSVSREERRRRLAPFRAAGFRLVAGQQCKQLLHAFTTRCVGPTFVCSVSREERRRRLAPFRAAGFRLIAGPKMQTITSCPYNSLCWMPTHVFAV